jgi:transposase
MMRGTFDDQGQLFSYISPEQRIAAEHPLRTIRVLVREVLAQMDRDFHTLYSPTGRPSIPPEQLLSALLLQVLYGIRSERQLMEQLDYNLLYRWFIGLAPDDTVWDATTFTKNRERVQQGDLFNRFMETLLHHQDVRPLLSDEHFSVDGTLIEAWAGHKSFKSKGDPGGDGEHFHGTRRRNNTHESTTDPDSRLYRKSTGKESKLCYMGHAMMENRNGLAVAGLVTLASGMAERVASEAMLGKKASRHTRITVGADKAYDVAEHVARLREKNITPHIAVNAYVTKTGKVRKTTIDGRTTRHKGYTLSQSKRKMIECLFGWGKQHGTMRKTKHRGLAGVATDFLLNLIGYNLVRIPKLLAERG